MALSKSERDALPDSDFAFPRTRQCPIHDSRHTRLAWDMVSRTQGVTDEERAEARRRILRRAEELGIDTGDWSKIKAMAIEAMSLDMPDVPDHPNRMPFSGIMTRIGEPSDEPPHGSGGRRVVLTFAAAEKALPSLLGMAVDLTADLDGHDAQAKVGIITGATIEGNAIHIDGFIYANDFPNEAARIRADKDILGFSFEAENCLVADPGADPLEIIDCVFTGAAILRKDKAAYQTTSLAAKAEKEGIDVTADELKAILDGAIKPLSDQLAATTAKVDAIEAAAQARVEASKTVIDQVEPHAKALESCAASMETAGIGCAAEKGHASALRRMAGSMRAEAAVGKVPHIWRDHDYPYYASADVKPADLAEEVRKSLASELEKGIAPIKAQLDDTKKKLEAAEAKAAEADTKLADLKAAAVRESQDPGRKTVSPAIQAMLSRHGLTMPEGDAKFDSAVLDAALKKANLDTAKRMEVKAAFTHAGLY
jgi:hypothetical protein